MKNPGIDVRHLNWGELKSAFAARIAELDEANRSMSNTPEKTMQFRVEIALLQEMMAWDRPGHAAQRKPDYALPR